SPGGSCRRDPVTCSNLHMYYRYGTNLSLLVATCWGSHHRVTRGCRQVTVASRLRIHHYQLGSAPSRGDRRYWRAAACHRSHWPVVGDGVLLNHYLIHCSIH